MCAIAAVVCFALALILAVWDGTVGPYIATDTLTLAGLLAMALHLAGVGVRRS